MSINTGPTNDKAETLKQSDPTIENLEATLQHAIAQDILAASRAQGVVPTESMVMQSKMLAAIASRAILRRIQVLKVRCTESLEVIEAHDREALAKVDPTDPNPKVNSFEATVVAPMMAEDLGINMVHHGFVRLDQIEGNGARSYIGTAFVLPLDAMNPPAPPPAMAPPSRIIRPGQ